MCGIFGCKTDDALKKVVTGLKRLEYRGYDSWGIAYIKKDNLATIKRVGKISHIDEKNFDEAKTAIGHTRWATHGSVNEKNAHPHLDCRQTLAVVHNGIIDNYEILKKKLWQHHFQSNTDTEVVAHMIEDYMKSKDFIQACSTTFKKLEGSFAILSLNKNKIVCIKKDSPLVIGYKNNSYYVSSDPFALSGFADKIYYLQDYEMAVIDNDLKIFNLKTEKAVDPVFVKFNNLKVQVDKKGYPHFMLKEIFEQCDVVRLIIDDFNENCIKKIIALIKRANNVYLTGCGTAHHAAMVAKYLFARIANVNVNTILASEFDLVKNNLDKNSLVIAISQSGETADVLSAIKDAKSCNAKTIAVVNVTNSSLTRICDTYILTKAGKELAVASTKAFTAQVCLMSLIAYGYANKLNTGLKSLKRLSATLNHGMLNRIKNLTDNIKINSKHLFTIGRGIDFPIAMEAALKIKEISYLHAEGFAGGELKHGTLALIEKGVPCIVFAADEMYYKDVINNAIEIKARGGYIIGISYKKNEIFDDFLPIKNIGLETSLVSVIPAQLIAYALAVNKGLNPDYPRNLAKCVTVK